MTTPKWYQTGRTRLTVLNRLFGKPLMSLEAEWENHAYYDNGYRPKEWRVASLEVLTAMHGLDSRQTPTGVRYRVHKKGLFRNTYLVMQVLVDPENGTWRDAHVEDLGDIAHMGGTALK